MAGVVSDGGEASFAGHAVMSFDDFLDARLSAEDGTRRFVVAIGRGWGRERMKRVERMKACGFVSQTVIHPTATVLGGAEIGEGAQILARAVVGVGVRLGNSVIVNTGAIVDHETKVGDGCHVAPGAVLLGRVTLGDRVFVGANATILPDLVVASDVVIGAGALVTRSITESGTYQGCPARRRSGRKAET